MINLEKLHSEINNGHKVFLRLLQTVKNKTAHIFRFYFCIYMRLMSFYSKISELIFTVFIFSIKKNTA